jgi:hypothetical protein
MKLRLSIVGLVLLGLAGCSSEVNPRVATRLNVDAALPGGVPNPMSGKVITSWIDRTNGTMSSLFGNDVAMAHARTNDKFNYPAGSVLSVITWQQQEDPRWFGGSIPAQPKSMEIVTIGGAYLYQRYEGSPLKKVAEESGAVPGERAAYVLSQRAAVMP